MARFREVTKEWAGWMRANTSSWRSPSGIEPATSVRPSTSPGPATTAPTPRHPVSRRWIERGAHAVSGPTHDGGRDGGPVMEREAAYGDRGYHRPGQSAGISLEDVLPPFHDDGRHAGTILDWSASVDEPFQATELRRV